MARATAPNDEVEAAYHRVRAVALGFPGAEEKLSHGAPAFHVKGKMFLTFVDNHHDDGHLAVWCKAAVDEQRRLVAENPARFFVPPYVGVKGWVGVNVDRKNADFIELAILVEEAWRSVAPPSVLRSAAQRPPGELPPPPARVTTDAKLAKQAFLRFSGLCAALPGAEVEKEGKHATFRVRKKVFAYFFDNHHGDGVVAACVKGDRRENARAIARDPERFYSPAYVGPHGYLGVKLNAPRVDWDDLEARLRASYAAVAPKALAAQLSAPANAQRARRR